MRWRLWPKAPRMHGCCLGQWLQIGQFVGVHSCDVKLLDGLQLLALMLHMDVAFNEGPAANHSCVGERTSSAPQTTNRHHPCPSPNHHRRHHQLIRGSLSCACTRHSSCVHSLPRLRIQILPVLSRSALAKLLSFGISFDAKILHFPQSMGRSGQIHAIL